MPKVDDELSRRLRRAERPVDVDGLFEGLERRRSHRERRRRVQAGMLAIAVVTVTAGGFVALRAAFDPDGRRAGESPTPVALPANGEIVFSREGADGRSHLYAVQPDGSGLRQVTDHVTNDSQPAVSPDGQTIAYVHQIDQRLGVIATIPIDGGTVTWQTEEGIHQDVSHPAWSPDGSKLAFVGSTVDSAALYVRDLNSGKTQALPEPAELEQWPAHPTWSPDGTRIAFAALDFTRSSTSSDLGVVHSDGTGLEWLVTTTDSDEGAPSWSPDGKRIAFIRPYGKKEGIWTMPATGGEASLVAVASELERDLAWAPDGSSLLVSDGQWIYRVDPTPQGDPGDNFVQLVRGRSPTWQPAEGSGPVIEPNPVPSATPSRGAGGRDIGLGFPLCHVEHLGNIDWYGDGTSGSAWTGARLTAAGRCPSDLDGEYVVAADLDGDGSAEPGGMGFLDHCLLCRPVAATDLSGDGVLELVVLEEASSTPSYSLYEVSVPTSERSPGIYSLFVAPPGYPAGGFPGGEPIRFSAGGDEGYSAAIDCEGYPEAPILVVAWSNYQVDVDDTEDVYVTRLRLGEDGAFHVIASEHFTQPVGDPLPIDPAGKACGVDFNPGA
jgi:dipeptidyl aminopeptidase/acylaminoacyl peptidase